MGCYGNPHADTPNIDQLAKDGFQYMHAYDRKSHIGKLDRGLDEASKRGWTVVSMKNDWKTIFKTDKNTKTKKDAP